MTAPGERTDPAPTDEQDTFGPCRMPVPDWSQPTYCGPCGNPLENHDWAGLWAERDALAAALSSARAENERLTKERDGWRDFTGAIGYGDNRSEPQIEPSQLLDVWREVTSLADEHTAVCPEWCDGCMQWEKPYSCERCHGSGCDAATALGAYSPCKDCDGERRNHESWNPTGQPTAAESDLAEARAENAALHDDKIFMRTKLNALAERAAGDRRALDEAQAENVRLRAAVEAGMHAVASLADDASDQAFAGAWLVADAMDAVLPGVMDEPLGHLLGRKPAALAAAQPTESAPLEPSPRRDEPRIGPAEDLP